jgi:hypothetical protein
MYLWWWGIPMTAIMAPFRGGASGEERNCNVAENATRRNYASDCSYASASNQAKTCTANSIVVC